MGRIFDLPLLDSLVPAVAAGSPTATFTRASTATLIDFEGIVRYALSGEARFYGARRVGNLHTTSSELVDVGWAKNGPATYTADAAVPNANYAQSTKIVSTGAFAGSYQSVVRIGDTVTKRVWMKGAVGGEIVGITDSANTGGTITLTTTWTLYSKTWVATDVSSVSCLITSSGQTIYLTGVQVEVVNGQSNQAPGEYVSVGVLSSPYHGANVDGVKYFSTTNGNSVNSSVVTEATGTAIADATLDGIIGEPAATNRALWSEDFSNAAWVKTSVTVSADSIASPDGTTTADTLTASGANGTVIQDLGVVGSAAKTGSVWLKRLTGTGNIQLTMDGGAGWTTVVLTAAWQRFALPQTVANEDFGIRIVTNGDAIYAWGGQVETGTDGATSYIPTTTIAVTRAVDSDLFATAGNMSTTAGTVFCEGKQINLGSGGSNGFVTDSAGTGLPIYTLANGRLSTNDGTTAASQAGALTPGTRYNMAATYSAAAGINIYQNGTVASAAFDGTMQMTSIAIAAGAGVKCIRNVKIWDTVMPIAANGEVIDAGGYTFTRRRRRM